MTPNFLGLQPFDYSYPKIDNQKLKLILQLSGKYIWKIDVADLKFCSLSTIKYCPIIYSITCDKDSIKGLSDISKLRCNIKKINILSDYLPDKIDNPLEN